METATNDTFQKESNHTFKESNDTFVQDELIKFVVAVFAVFQWNKSDAKSWIEQTTASPTGPEWLWEQTERYRQNCHDEITKTCIFCDQAPIAQRVVKEFMKIMTTRENLSINNQFHHSLWAFHDDSYPDCRTTSILPFVSHETLKNSITTAVDNHWISSNTIRAILSTFTDQELIERNVLLEAITVNFKMVVQILIRVNLKSSSISGYPEFSNTLFTNEHLLRAQEPVKFVSLFVTEDSAQGAHNRLQIKHALSTKAKQMNKQQQDNIFLFRSMMKDNTWLLYPLWFLISEYLLYLFEV